MVSKTRILKQRINAPARVYSNMDGEVFSGPGIGTPWRMPIRFLEKSGTPIYVSLTGEGGRKTVFQRSNREAWIKRFIASIAWKEARFDLGYPDAVVWIGTNRFQPTSEDVRSLGLTDDELEAAEVGVRTSVTRPAMEQRNRGDDPMAKKIKKVKKVKKSKKSKSGGDGEGQGRGSAVTERVHFLVERVKKGVVVTIDGRPKTKKLITSAVLGASINKAAFAYTDKFIGTKEEIGNKGAGLYLRIRKTLGNPCGGASSRKTTKKIKKAGKKIARKGTVKKVTKRPIAKTSKRKIIKKIRRGDETWPCDVKDSAHYDVCSGKRLRILCARTIPFSTWKCVWGKLSSLFADVFSTNPFTPALASAFS